MSQLFLFDEAMIKLVRTDLLREIPPKLKIYERVGFLFISTTEDGAFAPSSYMPIADENYKDAPAGYGTYYGQNAINKAIERIVHTNETIFSIHLHSGYGEPIPSKPDLKTEKILIECFSRIVKGPHGSIILSEDSVLIRSWNPALKVMEKVNNIKILCSESEDKNEKFN